MSITKLFCCSQQDDYSQVDYPESYQSGIGIRSESFENEVQVREVAEDVHERLPNSRTSMMAIGYCRLVGICCCLNLAILAIVGLVNLIIKRSSVHVDCLSTDYVDVFLPETPADYPEQWRGVIWLDQARAYNSALQGGGSGSLAMSFGDSVFNRQTRTIEVSTTGRSWTVENTASGYMKYFVGYLFDYRYSFTFDEIFAVAQIYPGFAPLGGILGTWSVPKFLVSITMELQDVSGHKKCPPATADWEAVKACAKWIRKSSVPLLAGLGDSEYAAYEIVDSTGTRTSFFSHYVTYANKVSMPSAVPAQIILGLDTAEASCDPGESSIVGI